LSSSAIIILPRLKFFANATDSSSDQAATNAKRVSNFLIRLVIEIHQQHGLVDLRKRIHKSLQKLRFTRKVRWRYQRIRYRTLTWWSAFALSRVALPRDRRVNRNSIRPSVKFGVYIILTKALPDLHQHLLDEVLGIQAHIDSRNPTDPITIITEDLLKAVLPKFVHVECHDKLVVFGNRLLHRVF
jgi:hypothetical protein